VFIIIKIKFVNSDNISDICDKLNFITNYIHFTTTTQILSKHIKITNFDIFNKTVPSQNLSISVKKNTMSTIHLRLGIGVKYNTIMC
jgi:hypothetical protein